MSLSSKDAEGSSFRPDIQGLRALAVLFVVLYHAKLPLFSGGYVGVDVFFVISGYLISGLLVREMERTGRINFAAFYARRIRRLLPAAAVVLLATALAARLWLSPLEQVELAPSLFFSALYASNIWFASQATDYLAGDVHTELLVHTWSLSVEEQFYLIWPLLIFLGARLLSPGRIRRAVLFTMSAVFVASLVASLWLTSVSQPWAFFSSPTRAWEFAAGGLAFMATRRVAAWSDGLKNICMLVGFAAMAVSVVFFNDRTTFPGIAALLPVLGTVLMITPGAARGWMARWLATPPMQTMGNVSYSWYLWHWPILVFPFAGPPTLPERLAGVVISFLLAWGTYLVVENRVRFSPLLAPSPMRSIALGVCLTLLGTGAGVALRGMGKQSLASPDQVKYNVRSDLPRVYRDGCHQPFRKDDSPECVYGDKNGARTVVLFGDSHAAQWFPALERIAQEKHWRLISLTKSACPSVWATPFRAELGRKYEECDRWRQSVVDRITRERPALVVLANAAQHVDGASTIGGTKVSQGIDPAEWERGMRATLTKLEPSGAPVVILRDTPLPGFDVPRCLSQAAWRGKDVVTSCSFDRGPAMNSHVAEVERRAAKEAGHATVIDLSDLVCAGPTCEPLLKGRVVYRDSHHLTVGISANLAPALLERFGARLPQGF
jgi:peptidoglycan/LPS O-acetylase OafA/YrhL